MITTTEEVRIIIGGLSESLENARFPRVIQRDSVKIDVLRDPLVDAGIPDATIQSAVLCANRLDQIGLTFGRWPYNFALYAENIKREKADRLATSIYQFMSVFAEEPFLSFRQCVRSSELTDFPYAWEELKTPFFVGRTDIVGGKVVEIGPTFIDGFGTAIALPIAFSMRSQETELFALQLRERYRLWTRQTGNKEFQRPKVAFISGFDAEDMVPEQRVVASALSNYGFETTVVPFSLRDITFADAQMYYFYGKPLNWMNRYRKQDVQWFFRMAQRQKKLILPSLEQDLDSKALLSVVFDPQWRKVLVDKLGEETVRFLNENIAWTRILPEQIDADFIRMIPFPCVLKPANAGSGDGVTFVADSTEFSDAIDRLRVEFPGQYIVMQESLLTREGFDPVVVQFPNGKYGARRIRRLRNPYSRRVMMTAGRKCVGMFGTFSDSPNIDDGGFSFPIV